MGNRSNRTRTERGIRALGAAVAGFQLGKLAGLAINLVQFPTVRRGRHVGTGPPPPSDPRGISLLVPARNEAERLPETLPSMLVQSVSEILVLDDGSTDGTADVARRCAGDDARFRVVPGRPLPNGWAGKTWACQQLADVARGALLVFCDADVTLAPGAVNAIHSEIEAQRAEVFSVFPRQQTRRAGERFLVPLIDDVLLSFLPHRLLRMPIPAAATANGQLLAARRDAYDALGGHAGVADQLVDDVAFARWARASGRRLGLALGGDLVGTRMYGSYAESVRGFGKSLRAAHKGSRMALALTAGWHVLAYTVPWLCWRRGRSWRLAAVVSLLHRVLVNVKTGRSCPGEALLVPLTPLAALGAYRIAWRDTATWKGRVYASGTTGVSGTTRRTP